MNQRYQAEFNKEALLVTPCISYLPWEPRYSNLLTGGNV